MCKTGCILQQPIRHLVWQHAWCMVDLRSIPVNNTIVIFFEQVINGRKEKALLNDALNTFYLRSYGVWHMVKDHSDSHMGYSFRLAARAILYASSHRQDNTYHGLCYTNRGTLAGTRNNSMCPPNEGSIRRPIAPWANALTAEVHLAPHQIRVEVNIMFYMLASVLFWCQATRDFFQLKCSRRRYNR